MIDLHILVPPTVNHERGRRWVKQAIDSIDSTRVTLNVVDSKLGPIGPQRLDAFRTGVNPYVSFVDYDDYVLPGAIDKALDELISRGCPGVVTRELCKDMDKRTEYITPFKHHLQITTREFVEEREALYRFDIQDRWIINTPEVEPLGFVGYVWRRYISLGRKQRLQERILPLEEGCNVKQ